MVDEEAGTSLLGCLKWFAVNLTKSSIYDALVVMAEDFKREHPTDLQEPLAKRLNSLISAAGGSGFTFDRIVNYLELTLSDYRRTTDYLFADAKSPVGQLFQRLEELSSTHQPLPLPQLQKMFYILTQRLLFDDDEGRQVARILCSEERLHVPNSFKMYTLLTHNLSDASFVAMHGYLVDMFVATFEREYMLTIDGAMYYNSMISAQMEPIIMYLFDKVIDRVDEKKTQQALQRILRQALSIFSSDRYHWIVRRFLAGNTDFNTDNYLYKLETLNLLLSLRPIKCEKTAQKLNALAEKLDDSDNQQLTQRLNRAMERMADWNAKLGLPGWSI